MVLHGWELRKPPKHTHTHTHTHTNTHTHKTACRKENDDVSAARTSTRPQQRAAKSKSGAQLVRPMPLGVHGSTRLYDSRMSHVLMVRPPSLAWYTATRAQHHLSYLPRVARQHSGALLAVGATVYRPQQLLASCGRGGPRSQPSSRRRLPGKVEQQRPSWKGVAKGSRPGSASEKRLAAAGVKWLHCQRHVVAWLGCGTRCST